MANYIIWRYSSTWSFQLDKRYDDAKQVRFEIFFSNVKAQTNFEMLWQYYSLSPSTFQNFLKVLTGKQVQSPRWKDCGAAATEKLVYAAGALYVREYFKKVIMRLK